MRLIPGLFTCVSVIFGGVVSAQDAPRAQEQVSAAIASEGFIPVALVLPLMRACDEMLSNAQTVDTQKSAFEYCGSMLSSSLKSAIQFKIAEPVPSLNQVNVSRLQDQLARALAAQVVVENQRDDLQSNNRLLTSQVAALRRQITALQALNDESLSDRDVARSPITSAANCWVLDAGSPAARVSVTVGFEIGSSGRVLSSGVRLLSADGGTGVAVETAFQAARRAVLRCQGEGYLPPNGIVEEQTVELVFNAETLEVQSLP
jgi:hypothetical protein